VSKFADHLPLYRQDGIFEREGVDIPRATQTSWVLQVYDAIRPLGDELKRAILDSDVLFTDDSIIPLQVKGNGKLKKARLWVYVRGGTDPPLTVYDFSHDRSKQRPLDFLEGSKGYAHADAYSGYDELFRREGIIEVGCWVHARREFDEATSSRPQETTEIMARIAKLYRVEAECAEMSPAERCKHRDQHSRPVLDGIFHRLDELKLSSLPSACGGVKADAFQAVSFIVIQWAFPPPHPTILVFTKNNSMNPTTKSSFKERTWTFHCPSFMTPTGCSIAALS
jgi:transposase